MSPPAGNDTLSRFVFEGAGVRGVRVRLVDAARDLLAGHAYPPALAAVLLELAGAAALLAAALKFDGTLAVQLAGTGPVRLIVVECNPGFTLRATAQWDSDAVAALPVDADLKLLAGDASEARLAITLDARTGGPIYQGIVELRSTSVAQTIAHYLKTSEQVASALAIARDGSVLSGLLLQRMPASTAQEDALWDRVSGALAQAEAAEVALAAASDAGLSSLFAPSDLRLFAPVAPHFACTCSVERVERALRIAGRDEIEATLADAGEVLVTCEFCARNYRFGHEAARAVFASPPAPTHAGSTARH